MEKVVYTEKVFVKEIHLSQIQSGESNEFGNDYFETKELGDGGRTVEQANGDLQKKYVLGFLTKRQQKVAILLEETKDRKEVSNRLGIGLQAVHQIVLRMRKRMRKRIPVSQTTASMKQNFIFMENLIFLYLITNPSVPIMTIFQDWYKNKVLSEYNRPEKEEYLKICRKVLIERI
jgi:hypothetical protein